MIKQQHAYNDRQAGEYPGEGNILIEMYESPDVPLSSYTLTQRLNPDLPITTPEYRTAFAHVSSVVEEHIARGLIRGKRSKSADGVFFNNLKLTYKGEQAAIQERKRRTLPDRVKQLLDVLELIRKNEEKK